MIADIKKNGGKVRDLIKRKKCELEETTEEYTGDYEDNDVKMEREKVAKMNMSDQSDEAGQPIVIVKVSWFLGFTYDIRYFAHF
jgi:hypothetical protein